MNFIIGFQLLGMMASFYNGTKAETQRGFLVWLFIAFWFGFIIADEMNHLAKGGN